MSLKLQIGLKGDWNVHVMCTSWKVDPALQIMKKYNTDNQYPVFVIFCLPQSQMF